jgi:hypothetical protein
MVIGLVSVWILCGSSRTGGRRVVSIPAPRIRAASLAIEGLDVGFGNAGNVRGDHERVAIR